MWEEGDFFVTEFVILGKNPPFYEVNQRVKKRVLRMEEFQNKNF